MARKEIEKYREIMIDRCTVQIDKLIGEKRVIDIYVYRCLEITLVSKVENYVCVCVCVCVCAWFLYLNLTHINLTTFISQGLSRNFGRLSVHVGETRIGRGG